MELELPRLLAPDLPSNRSSLKDLNCTHSDGRLHLETTSLFFVTTSPCREWVICVPAAFLGCGSRLSGSLSRVKPLFSVTRYHHGRHVNYHRKLIRQTFERCVAGTRPCDLPSYSDSPNNAPREQRDWFCSNKSTASSCEVTVCSMY